MICFPNAKINLGLHVIDKRADGFHNIESVFVPVPLFDMLEIVENRDWKQGDPDHDFTAAGLNIDGSADDNLVLQACRLLAADHALPPLKLFLYKHIPMGAGLGGGSADAAFALKLLNEQFSLGLDAAALKTYAARLGSDCTFFIDNTPAYLHGKGHELEPYTINLKGYYFVLLYPEVHSATAGAYSKVKLRGKLDASSSLKQALQLPVKEWKANIENDFEPQVLQSFREVAACKQGLYEAGARFALMTGSGSSVFGLFDAKPVLPEGLAKQVVLQTWL